MCWESFVCGYLAAGDGGELNALGRYLHDDVVIHDPGGTTAIGIDHEKETWRKARNAMVGLRHEFGYLFISPQDGIFQKFLSSTDDSKSQKQQAFLL